MKLQELSSEFKQWRDSGRPGQKVPNELRLKAVELSGEYKISEVLKTLGINGKTLNSWKEEHHVNEPVFIALAPVEVKERKTLSEELSLKFRRSNSGNWSVEGRLSLKDWQSAIRLLEGVK